MNNRQETRLFYANVKWFTVAEQPARFEDLPEEFMQAYSLWKSKPESSTALIAALMQPFVKARLVLCNVEGWDEIFSLSKKVDLPELESVSTQVVGCDFFTLPIPACKAEAIFKISVTDSFSNTDFDDWQENNASLADAVVFYWDIKKNNLSSYLDLTMADTQGIEFVEYD